MLMRLLGVCLIVFAGASAGFAMARRCSDRTDSLRQLLSCVVSLKAYMNYASLPLADCLTRCAAGTGREMAAFFDAAAELLRRDYLLAPRDAMAAALTAHRRRLALAKEDCELLLLLACNLGRTDRAEQEKYLTMIERRLEILEREAAGDRDRNCRMYRYLGVCGSLLVVLLLI